MRRIGSRRRSAAAGVIAVAFFGTILFVGLEQVQDTGSTPVGQAVAVAPNVAGGVEVKAASATLAPAPTSRPDGTVEVCGLGWVKRPGGEADAQALMNRLNLAQPRQRILEKLRADPREFARATALLIAFTSSDEPGWLTRLGLVPDDHAAARDQLARLAASTSDAKVYALAYKACGGNGNAGLGACQLINAEQWARLDPQNAAPWLFMLWTATSRKDLAAQDESLHRIASARHQSLGYFDTAGAILEAAPDDDGAQFSTWMMVTEAIGFEAAVAIPGLTPLRKACTGDALADVNRRQTCSAIAEVLTERSDTLLDRGIGVSIGKRVGWPAERYETLQAESVAYSMAVAPADRSVDDFSCARLRRDMAGIRGRAAVGEIASVREWVKESGKTHEDFVRENRAYSEQMQRAVREEAASAATAGTDR